MPWKGVTMNEERHRFLQEHRLGYCFVSDPADRFSVSRQTAHKWIRRHKLFGDNGFHELSRRPYNSPSQTDGASPMSSSPCANPTLLGRPQAPRPPPPPRTQPAERRP